MNECPICIEYAKFFKRDYESCEAVYHANHTCICGHLHSLSETCMKDCGCNKFISQEGMPALKTTLQTKRKLDPYTCDKCGIALIGEAKYCQDCFFTYARIPE